MGLQDIDPEVLVEAALTNEHGLDRFDGVDGYLSSLFVKDKGQSSVIVSFSTKDGQSVSYTYDMELRGGGAEGALATAKAVGKEHAHQRHLIIAGIVRSRWPNAVAIEAHLHHYYAKGSNPEVTRILDAGNSPISYQESDWDVLHQVENQIALALDYVPRAGVIGWARGGEDGAAHLQLPAQESHASQ